MIRKIIFFILLIPLFLSCQVYIEPTNVQFNINGEWKIIDITPTYSEDVLVINDEFYAISPFNVISITDNSWIIRNDTTNIQACYFFKIGYVWEFDYNQLIIKDNAGQRLGWYYVGYINGNYLQLVDKETMTHIGGVYIMNFPTYPYGVSPSTMIYITVPELNFNLDGPERSFNRLINQNITLTLVR